MNLTTLKGLLLSKTVWFNLLTILSLIAVGDDIKQFVSADTIIKIQAAINIIIRFFTTQSLEQKGK